MEAIDSPPRKVSVALWIGIALLPVVFVWFLLRQGYSVTSRVAGFGWLIIALLVTGASHRGERPQGRPMEQAATAAGGASSESSSSVWTVTAANYEDLKTGMTYEDAQKIIGSPGEELSSSELSGQKTVMIAWKNWDGSNMNAMFQNNRLVTKAQFGLH